MENRPKIFIPFIDGMLNFDCQECGYSCCQAGGNLLMNAKEKRLLIQKYPHLRYFFVNKTKKIYTVRKYPRCWFLESNGLCYIQKEYGYSSKPLICRLHPFYIARCVDKYVVLLLPKECPNLYVDGGNKNVSRKRILKNAQEAIDNDCILEKIPWSGRRLNLERKVLEGSKMFLDSSSYLDFSAYQISITTKNKNIAGIKSELLESVELWKSFFNIDDLDIDDKILTYELTAITSVIRTGSIDLRRMKEDKVPLALLALYFYMILFSKTRRRKNYVETYQQILRNAALRLLRLEKEDLKIKNTSLESKLLYLALLQRPRKRSVIHTSKNARRK